jgi:hypothetical protein
MVHMVGTDSMGKVKEAEVEVALRQIAEAIIDAEQQGNHSLCCCCCYNNEAPHYLTPLDRVMQSLTAMKGAAVDNLLCVEANTLLVRDGQMLQRLFVGWASLPSSFLEFAQLPVLPMTQV